MIHNVGSWRKINSGIGTNHDSTLNSDEITDTSYVCNPDTSANSGVRLPYSVLRSDLENGNIAGSTFEVRNGAMVLKWVIPHLTDRGPNATFSGEQLRSQACTRAKTYHGGTRYSNKGRKVLCQQPRVKYAFIRENQNEFSIATMCKLFKIHRSGFFAWLKKPLSDRAIENNCLLKRSTLPVVALTAVLGYVQIYVKLMSYGVLIK
ncbi:DUF7151 family protein [Pseudoalteromonas luteoviolacea]|uniref:DUF7151 family protein n=1 Tax=Pseudoalteromonas luteoviolacea TaxID=43657 RepID=UPI00114D7047|nr:hypothetical protein [Pseudoalteromonas luteoviolacea]TQF72934.1 hypothetical protein FLM44_18695 [Pseudoalteromonas luteoviolacea]